MSWSHESAVERAASKRMILPNVQQGNVLSLLDTSGEQVVGVNPAMFALERSEAREEDL